MKFTDDICPITCEPAKRVIHQVAGRVEYLCNTCGRLQIVETAAVGIHHLDRDTRVEALQRAQERAVSDGSVPLVRMGDFLAESHWR